MRRRLIAAAAVSAAIVFCVPPGLTAYAYNYDYEEDDDEEDYDFYMDPPTMEQVRHLSDRSQITLVWKSIDDATGYQIQYTQKGKYTKANTINTNENRSATIRGLKKGKDCRIRIRACNDEYGIKTYSDWTEIKVKTTRSTKSAKSSIEE